MNFFVFKFSCVLTTWTEHTGSSLLLQVTGEVAVLRIWNVLRDSRWQYSSHPFEISSSGSGKWRVAGSGKWRVLENGELWRELVFHRGVAMIG